MGLTVSQLADRAGISPDTIRYYDRIGVLRAAARSAAGYRLFDEEAAERLAFIRSAQRFGLRLDAIAELLEIRERGLCPCGHTRALLEQRLAEVQREQEALDRLREELERVLRGAPAPSDGAGCGLDLVELQPRRRA